MVEGKWKDLLESNEAHKNELLDAMGQLKAENGALHRQIEGLRTLSTEHQERASDHRRGSVGLRRPQPGGHDKVHT